MVPGPLAAPLGRGERRVKRLLRVRRPQLVKEAVRIEGPVNLERREALQREGVALDVVRTEREPLKLVREHRLHLRVDCEARNESHVDLAEDGIAATVKWRGRHEGEDARRPAKFGSRCMRADANRRLAVVTLLAHNLCNVWPRRLPSEAVSESLIITSGNELELNFGLESKCALADGVERGHAIARGGHEHQKMRHAHLSLCSSVTYDAL